MIHLQTSSRKARVTIRFENFLTNFFPSFSLYFTNILHPTQPFFLHPPSPTLVVSVASLYISLVLPCSLFPDHSPYLMGYTQRINKYTNKKPPLNKSTCTVPHAQLHKSSPGSSLPTNRNSFVMFLFFYFLVISS